MKRIIILAAWLITPSLSAGQPALAEFEDWARGLELDPRVAAEIQDFSHRGASLDNEYAEKLGAQIRSLILQESVTRIRAALAGEQEPFISVEYPEPGFAMMGHEPTTASGRQFEKGFIRTEVVAVFEGEEVSPQTALLEYTKPEFRKLSSSQLKEIRQEGELLCVETKGMALLLDPTLSCNRIHEFHRPGLSAQHSQAVSNPGGDRFQRVYFKESLKVFLTTPQGLALYYINFSRTTDLGRMSKYVGRGKIVQSQQKAIDEMQQVLNLHPGTLATGSDAAHRGRRDITLP